VHIFEPVDDRGGYRVAREPALDVRFLAVSLLSPCRDSAIACHHCPVSSCKCQIGFGLFGTVWWIYRALILWRLRPHKIGNPIWHRCRSQSCKVTLRLVTRVLV